MFDYHGDMDAPTPSRPAPAGSATPTGVAPGDGVVRPGGPTGAVRAGELLAALDMVSSSLPTCSDVELVEIIAHLEDVKNACCATQARASVALREIREESCATEKARLDAHRSTVSEIALARRESPHQARILLGLATVLTRELPETMAHLSAGRISEWKAMLVAKETACLDLEDRLTVDRQLAAGLADWSNRELSTHARQLAYQLDAHSVVRRAARAQSDRRVTIRPAPDCMTVVSALLPAAQGVAVYAALLRAFESARAAGDSRGRGQVMADTMVTRTTGQSTAEAVPVEVQVVITGEALVGESETPARLGGHGPIPAHLARTLVTRPDGQEQTSASTDTVPGVGGLSEAEAGTGAEVEVGARQWLRRLWVEPTTGELLAMESTRRIFPAGLRRFIATRDSNTCRTPWCSAPVAHIDHVVPVRLGGLTSTTNGQGLCIHCNQTKEAPGWSTHGAPDGSTVIITPTATRHTSRPPPLPHQPRAANPVGAADPNDWHVVAPRSRAPAV